MRGATTASSNRKRIENHKYVLAALTCNHAETRNYFRFLLDRVSVSF